MLTELERVEIGDRQLLAELQRLSEDLEVPFVKRQLTQGLHRPLLGTRYAEQLEEAVTVLTRRERDLAATIGTSRLLLARNKELSEEVAALFESSSHWESVAVALKQEKFQYEKSVLHAETQCSQLRDDLTASEDRLAAALSEVERLATELSYWKKQPNTISALTATHQSEVEEIEEKHSAEVQALRKTVHCLERERDGLRKACAEVERAAQEKAATVRKLEETTLLLRAADRKRRDETADLAKRCEVAERRAKYLELDLSIAQRKAEKLEEELQLLSTAPDSNTHGRHTSLFSKLHGIEEGEEAEESLNEAASATGCSLAASWHREMSLDLASESTDELFTSSLTCTGARKSKFYFDDPPLQVSTLACLSISGKPKSHCRITPSHCVSVAGKRSHRKDPSEEYFTLVSSTQTTQAVKFNSPYVDIVCSVPAKELFKKAMSQEVPFYQVSAKQWHRWIEDELTREYVNSLYKPQRSIDH